MKKILALLFVVLTNVSCNEKTPKDLFNEQKNRRGIDTERILLYSDNAERQQPVFYWYWQRLES